MIITILCNDNGKVLRFSRHAKNKGAVHQLGYSEDTETGRAFSLWLHNTAPGM
jgi:hypothetical protein